MTDYTVADSLQVFEVHQAAMWMCDFDHKPEPGTPDSERYRVRRERLETAIRDRELAPEPDGRISRSALIDWCDNCNLRPPFLFRDKREDQSSNKAANIEISGDRSYTSDKLAFLNQAASLYWANAKREERDTHPKNADVVHWLTQHGYSQTLAEKAATIIRPEWAPTGRKPEE